MPRASKAPASVPVPVPGSNYPVLKGKGEIAAAEEYALNQAETKRLKHRQTELKALLLKAMAGAPKAAAGKRMLSVTSVEPEQPTENVVITKDMIGQLIPGSPGKVGYDMLSVR